jgi:predicted ferric reductase
MGRKADTGVKSNSGGSRCRMPWRAAMWLGIYLALVTAPLVVLLVGPMPPGRGFWFDFSVGLGFAAMAMIGIQFALTARFHRVSAPFGIDIVYLFHRYLAIAGLFLVLGHFAILWVGYPEALGEFDPRKAPLELTLGRIALALFALAVITSQWRKQLRIEYGLWRYAHVAFATLGFAAAVGHIAGVGYYTEAPVKRTLWLAFTLVWILLILWVRVVRPWRQKRQPYRVAEVRDEGSRTWTLALEPDGHVGMRRFLPGQFAWLTLRADPFLLREHPFSISSPPERLPRVEFTIKQLGDFTETMATVKPGEAVYLDGPYGVFSVDRDPAAPGFAFIVGGVGITPVISMLRSMATRGETRPLWLIYANPTWDAVVFRDETAVLGDRLALTVVHVLEKPPPGWIGERGFVTREALDRHLPQGELRRALHYFLCGPSPLLDVVETGLHDLSVGPDRIQVEVFDLV